MIENASANCSEPSVLDFIHFHGVDPASREAACRTRPSGSERREFSRATRISAAFPEVAIEMDPFTAWLLRRGGICPDAYRAKPMHRRLPACLRQLRVDSPEEARALLEAKPELFPAALNCMLLGVTSFFRDRAVFEAIESEVVPCLLREKEALKIFSLGVAEGQELFSIAMLLAEAGALAKSSLLGVDCRPDAIRRAQAACYPETDLASVTPERRARFFFSRGTMWQICEDLRHALQWQLADLHSFHVPQSDLILFRNVAIYLEDEPVARIWKRLYLALAPGGYLITGKAEKPPRSLPFHRTAPSVYRKAKV
jgi:chemotaxis methyl-accepting protein methylase